MAISFVSAGGNSRAANGNVTPGLPGGWVSSDIFICVIVSKDNVNSVMPPGWVAIDTGTNNGASFRTTTYYKIAVIGDTNPTVTHIGGSNIEATIVAYRGVDSVNPFDIVGTTRVNPSSTTVTATSITTLTDTAWVVFTGSIFSRSTFSTYSGTPVPTERIDVPNIVNYPSTFIADFVMNTAGSTSNRTCIATNAAVNNGLMFALRPTLATIICITDPSNANIYLNGILQSVNTSIPIAVLTGNYTVTFDKAGYYPYTETVTGIVPNQVVKVAEILTQIVNIIDSGIVTCTGLNISTCPVSPISCPMSVTPLDYVNLIAILNVTSATTVTVAFTYTLNNVINYANVTVSLVVGTNIVYAFPTNIQYSSDIIVELKDVILS